MLSGVLRNTLCSICAYRSFCCTMKKAYAASSKLDRVSCAQPWSPLLKGTLLSRSTCLLQKRLQFALETRQMTRQSRSYRTTQPPSWPPCELSNPRPCGLAPGASALDQSAKLSERMPSFASTVTVFDTFVILVCMRPGKITSGDSAAGSA